jgi:hypothetical protein
VYSLSSKTDHVGVNTVERLDQGHLHPQLEVRPGIKPRPPQWEASTLEKNHSNSLLQVHKNENGFGSDFEFWTISLLVMLKY